MMKLFYVKAKFFSEVAGNELNLERIIQAKTEESARKFLTELCWDVLELNEVTKTNHLLIIVDK